MTHGVVQGSLIGPVLYLLFTNAFESYISDAEMIMYADDVEFLHSNLSGDIDVHKSRVASTLKEAHCWFVENSLKVNPTKTEILLFKTRQRHMCTDFSVVFNPRPAGVFSRTRPLGGQILPPPA